MTKKIDGGSAFPRIWEEPGMSLRDYFAAKAMQSILSAEQNIVGLALNEGSPQSISSDAYVMADAMISERSNKNLRAPLQNHGTSKSTPQVSAILLTDPAEVVRLKQEFRRLDGREQELKQLALSDKDAANVLEDVRRRKEQIWVEIAELCSVRKTI